MKKKKLLVVRYGAYGDWIYTVPILPYLFSRYDVVLECSPKVGMLAYNDPGFEKVECFDWAKEIKVTKNMSRLDVVKACGPIFDKRTKYLVDTYKPDEILNLNGSLETVCIPESFQEEFHLPIEERRKLFLKDSFYDAIFKRATIPVPQMMKLDCLYYSKKELDWGKSWREKNKEKFIIILAVAGSTFPKVFHGFKDYITAVLDKYPDVEFYLTGDEQVKKILPKHPRVKDACFNAPMKQIFLMTKYADYVVGPETGVVAAAGMWGTPKTMMCTMSSIDQTTKYQQNDHSIQAPIYCSPCVRAIYNAQDCHEVKVNEDTGNIYAPCTKLFRVGQLMDILSKVRKNYREGTSVPHLTDKYLSRKGGQGE